MRKFLSAVFAVLMMVSVLAVLPVAAATDTVDKTTESDIPDLLVTEVCWNSMCFEWNMKSVDDVTGIITYKDVYDYIEVYNAGDTPVRLYDYALLYSNERKISIDGGEKHLFDGKIAITPEVEGRSDIVNPGYNDPEATLQPGEIGIIWVWTADTVNACDKKDANLGAPGKISGDSSNEVVNFPKFREHYMKGFDAASRIEINQNISEDESTKLEHVKSVKIVAVYSSQNINLGNSNCTWAIAESDYALAEEIVQSGGLNEKIVTLFSNGCNTPSGTQVADGNATIHVPATAVPHRYNQNAYLNEWTPVDGEGNPVSDYQYKETYDQEPNYTPAESYLTINFVESYKQMAIINYAQIPTMGSMPSWQWAYVDPARISDALTNHLVTDAPSITTGADATTGQGGVLNANWQNDAIQALINAVLKMEDVDDSESGFDYTHFLTAEQNKDFIEGLEGGGTANTGKTKKKGLPTWALILIIVGGVVIVGGGVAVAVIIILKKKKGADDVDVVIEGDVVEADALTAEDAPVAEDAPAEEDKKEE